jgi:hypothetical protein
MNMMNFQALTGFALMVVMSVAGLVFTTVSLAEVPPLDAMTPEHVETATFSLG